MGRARQRKTGKRRAVTPAHDEGRMRIRGGRAPWRRTCGGQAAGRGVRWPLEPPVEKDFTRFRFAARRRPCGYCDPNATPSSAYRRRRTTAAAFAAFENGSEARGRIQPNRGLCQLSARARWPRRLPPHQRCLLGCSGEWLRVPRESSMTSSGSRTLSACGTSSPGTTARSQSRGGP